jgi:hypothetical protein
MVTHSSTSRPVQYLCMAERTGCPVLTDLWSHVRFTLGTIIITSILQDPGAGDEFSLAVFNDSRSAHLAAKSRLLHAPTEQDRAIQPQHQKVRARRSIHDPKASLCRLDEEVAVRDHRSFLFPRSNMPIYYR